MYKVKPKQETIKNKLGNNRVHPSTPLSQNQSANPLAHNLVSGGSSLLTGLKEGFIWGASTAVGSRLVDSIIGPRTVQVEHKTIETKSTNTSQSTTECENIYKNFHQCIKTQNYDCDSLIPDKCR